LPVLAVSTLGLDVYIHVEAMLSNGAVDILSIVAVGTLELEAYYGLSLCLMARLAIEFINIIRV
jgi:hypothetical protein